MQRFAFPLMECAMLCTVGIAACVVYEFAFNPPGISELARSMGFLVSEPDGIGIQWCPDHVIPASGR